MSSYYYLVAGLPDISPEDTKLSEGYTEFLSELMQALSAADARLLAYFRMPYENRNLLAWLKDKNAAFHPLGLLTPADMEEQWQMIDYEDRPAMRGVPPYFVDFLRERRDALIPEGGEENRLTGLFYDYAAQAPNAFVREWFRFERNLNNLLTALACRKYGWDMESQLVGDDAVCQALRSSTARDFGLSSVFPQVEQVLRVVEEPDLLQREKKLDRLRWDYLDDLSEGCYFSVEVLLSYLIRLQGLERWIALDPKKGEETFRQLILSLKETVKTESK